MRIHAKIQKWGNGLTLRVGGTIRDITHFKGGTEVLYLTTSTVQAKSDGNSVIA